MQHALCEYLQYASASWYVYSKTGSLNGQLSICAQNRLTHLGNSNHRFRPTVAGDSGYMCRGLLAERHAVAVAQNSSRVGAKKDSIEGRFCTRDKL